MRSVVALALIVGLAACSDGEASEQSTASATIVTVASTTSTTTSPTTAGTSVAVATTAETTPHTTPQTTPGTTGAPPPSSASTVAADVVTPEGFEQVAAKATMADGTVCDLCLWLADTGAKRELGLMFATDLGSADGMVFAYPKPTSGAFWMKNTLMPLSIAFYDAEGAFLDSFDMEPCTADPCATYPTPDGFVYAVETTQGGLEALGMAPGSTLAVSDLPCSPA